MTTGDDFIALAGRLAAGVNPSAVVLRTAINRAYYGAFHLTLQYFSDLGIAPGEEHNLHAFLCNSDNRDADQAGKILSDLYGKRRLADYKLSRMEVETQAVAQYAVEMAHRFRSHLAECASEPARTGIRAAIELYCQKIGRKPT